jgi:putative transcriptional regulator
MMKKRDLFKELCSGVADMRAHRTGKLTLRSTKLIVHPLPRLRHGEISKIRKRLGVSQPLFADLLHINRRTLQRWERGQNAPNDQAIVLIRLVDDHPEIMQFLTARSA